MKQCVVIHGAENFVGRRLRSRLSQSEWAQPVAGTGGDATALPRALPGAEAIVQCVVGDAAAIEAQAADLYAALACTGATPRLVHLSSMTVYGSACGSVTEHSELRADLGPYSTAQRDAERLATGHGNVVILRSAAEYGPECPYWSARIARLLRAHRLGDLGPAGDGICNLTYIDDLVTAIVAALRQPGIRGEIFNIALDYKPTWNEYFIAFARALGAVPVSRISACRLNLERRILAAPLKATEMLAHRVGLRNWKPPPPIWGSLLRLCRQEIALEVSKAERCLEMRWTSLPEGLAAAASDLGRA